jgi:hypothetical protein
MVSLSFLLREASHAEPFEPVERPDRILIEGGNTGSGAFKPATPQRKLAKACLPFSPQRDASVARL